MLVVDSAMGTGKSTWAINHVKNNLGKTWLYVTPFITEVERVSRETGITPVVDEGDESSKIKYARSLIKAGQSLVVTHSLFVLLNQADLLALSEYDIIVDETLPVTKLIPISSAEVKLLFKEGFLSVTEELKGASKLKLSTPDKYKKTKLGRFMTSYFDNGGELFLSDNNILAMLLPEFFFKKHTRVTVLTYNFDNTELDCYFDLKQIPVTKKSVVNGELVEYKQTNGERFRDLITVIDHKKLNETEANKNQRFTKAWYSRRTKKELDALRNNLYNFFRHQAKTKPEQNLWTVFSNNEMFEYMSDSDGAQWMMTKRCSKPELKEVLTQHPYNQIGREPIVDNSEASQKRKCFIPLNAKGTNIYGDRTALAYMVNLNLNPATKLFFQSTIDRAPSDDVFALNMMTQWLFRGAVRNGEPMTVYLPSKKMRHLLLKWLGYTDEELF